LAALPACADRLLPPGPPVPLPDAAQIERSVFLIGDAGAPSPDEPVLAALSALLATAPESSLVVFLGDNLYPRGLPAESAPNRAEAERRIDAQIAAARVGTARAIFVPGNHDWDKSGKDGLPAIRRQGAHIALRGEGRAVQLPADGCPGPVVEDQGGLRLVLLDTEWLLRVREKGVDGCLPNTRDGVFTALGDAIATAGPRPVVVAAHHPLMSGGVHGGHFSLGDHLFPLRELNKALWIPLPILGSIYPIVRGAGVSDQDMAGGGNGLMRASLDSVFALHPPMLYASGHEHSLQLIDRGRPPLLAVSGTGYFGHQDFLETIPGHRLALSEPGFMRVDRLRDGRVRLAVVTVRRNQPGREVWAEWLVER
jgi:hypothetical protein